MNYGTIKVDQITFTNAGVDDTLTVSGIMQSMSGSMTVTGTIQGETIIGTSTISGATVTGNIGQFTSITGVTGVFTSYISGLTITGDTAQFITVTGGSAGFTTITGTTVTGTTANFVSGIFSAEVSGLTVRGTTVSGLTVTGNVGSFATLTGGVITLTSGVFGAGTAALPSISFSGDPNTGIYSPGADQLAISTNGTGRLFVNASGNVGVGTSPSTTFHVAGNARIGAADANAVGVELGEGATGNRSVRIDFVGDTTYTDYGLRIIRGSGGANGDTGINHRGTGLLRLNAEDAGAIGFNANGSERMRLDSSGRLGLGTSSPSQILHVNGSTNGGIRVEGTGFSTGANIQILNTSNSNTTPSFIGQRTTATPTRGIEISDGTNPYFYVDTSNGRVGIGTTSPDHQLVVQKDSGATEIVINAQDGTSTANLRYRSAGTTSAQIGSVGSNLFFSTGTSERARIDSSGRLLVGTSSAFPVRIATTEITPRQQLYGSTGTDSSFVQGCGSTIDSTAAFHWFAKFASGTVNDNTTAVVSDERLGTITWSGSDGTNQTQAAQIECRVDGTPGANDMPGRLVFSTTADGSSSPTERLRISQNGVVTIKNGAVAEIDTLADGATITPDLSASCNFTVTISGNRTLANPSNITAGQTGSIFIVQGTGSNTLSWGSYWDFPAGTAPTLSTASGAVDRVDYIVRTSTSIHTVFTANYS